MSSVLASLGLGPLATNGPVAPVQPPGMWVVLAWARRQSEQALLDEHLSIGPDPVQTSLAVDSFATEESYGAASEQQTFALAATTAETNAAPDAAPTADAPDDITGVVAGSLNATDLDGDVLTYAVSGAPTGGTVTVDEAGTWVYTPTQATRLKAGSTAGGDIDSFTVTISDGQTTTAVPVTVAVSNQVTSVDPPIPVGTRPTGVATTATYTYVADQFTNTVSVIDRYNQVISTITGFSAPTGVAASPDGSKVYITNRSTGKVSVIDTNTNQVVSTITVGSAPTGIAVNLVDGRVYVTNTNSGTVSVINPATNTVTNTIRVGSAPTGVAVGDDGRVYVANRSSGTVSVISPTTNAVIKTITVGSSPSYAAVSPDGDRVYVTNNSSNTVSVIDTTTTAYSFTKITVGSQPYGVAVSPDGSLVYVANGNDTVSVIDAKAKTVTTVMIDPAAETSTHLIAVSPDGNTVYVTDNYTNDKAVRVISTKHLNAAPVAATTPTTPAPDANGVVTGQLNVTDPDGDKLTYTVTDPPEGGTVTVDAAGDYTYTPTTAAREAAYNSAQDPDPDTFTVTSSDGQYTKAVPVTVTISPAPPPPPPSDLTVTTTPISVGTDPTGVAVIGPTDPNDSTPHQAYVVNSGDFTVSVIDTDPSSATYNHVITTIPVGYYPTRVAASPEGDRVYVANYDTVSVIDTTTNAVTVTIPVPSDGCGQGCYNGVWDVAVSPDGDVLYAAVGDGTVSKIDTNTGHVISTTPVGFWDGDMELNPDGSRLYATDGVSDTVVVYDTASMQRVGTVDVGPGQFDQARNVAISPDGTRAYVTEEVRVVERASGGYSSGWFIIDAQGNTWVVTDTYSAVSAIDTDPTSATYNRTIATITVPDGALDLAISPDGRRAYVTHSDGKAVTVIDTATNQVIRTFTTDQNSTAGSQYITVGPDGRLYITDQADGTAYAVTVGDATAL